jgi:hypothetical protein
LGVLVDAGILVVEEPARQHRPTTYGFIALTSRRDSLSPLKPRGDTGETNGTSSPLIRTGINYSDNSKSDPLHGFPQFWEQYPRRNGKRLHKSEAQKQWAKLSLDDRRAAWRGAVNYAEAITRGLHLAAQDAFRWLRERAWEDWQEPAEPDVRRVVEV